MTARTVTPDVNSPWVHIAKHVATLFLADSLLPGEAMEIRCFRGKKIGPRRFFPNHAELIRDVLRWRELWDVYIGVGARRCPDGVPMKDCPHDSPGAKDHVGRLPAAWVEIDVGKPHADEAAILDAIDSAQLAPDLLVSSGGGIHAYFVFPSPLTELTRVEQVNRALMRRVGKDAAVDASRVLRLAGTINFKYSPPRRARVVRAQVIDADAN